MIESITLKDDQINEVGRQGRTGDTLTDNPSQTTTGNVVTETVGPGVEEDAMTLDQPPVVEAGVQKTAEGKAGVQEVTEEPLTGEVLTETPESLERKTDAMERAADADIFEMARTDYDKADELMKEFNEIRNISDDIDRRAQGYKKYRDVPEKMNELKLITKQLNLLSLSEKIKGNDSEQSPAIKGLEEKFSKMIL